MIQANVEFLKALATVRNAFLDTLMLLLTELGTEIAVIGVVCILYWCINKNTAYRIGMVFFASGLLVQGLKVGFHIERPWIIDPSFQPVSAAKEGATGYSFPSGHTQGATALYGTLCTVTKKNWLKAIFVFLIVTVAFTRLYLGVHTPLDVIVSALVSSACIFLFVKVAKALERGNSRDLAVLIALVSASVFLCIFAYSLFASGCVDRAHINDCFKSGGAGLGFALGWYLERRYLRFDVKTDKIWKQIVKVIAGVAVAVGLKSGLKLISPDNLAVDFIRYFLTVFWVIYIYPAVFSLKAGKKSAR